MTPICELAEVTRSFRDGKRGRVVAVHRLSLRVDAGELLAVMGPSGCGKSTLLALAGGIERPDEGAVLLHGAPLVDTASERARRLRDDVGFVFQELNLLVDLTAAENVALPLELRGARRRAAREQALAELSLVGLRERADEFPADLSGGEQQRIAVARALIGGRGLLLADEPTGALDTIAAELVMRLIRDRCDGGAAVIVATHDASVAAVADRVVYLRDGRMIGHEHGAAEQVAELA